MPVTAPSWKTVDAGLPADGFGVPDIYVEEGDKDKDADRLFVDMTMKMCVWRTPHSDLVNFLELIS